MYNNVLEFQVELISSSYQVFLERKRYSAHSYLFGYFFCCFTSLWSVKVDFVHCLYVVVLALRHILVKPLCSYLEEFDV